MSLLTLYPVAGSLSIRRYENLPEGLQNNVEQTDSMENFRQPAG